MAAGKARTAGRRRVVFEFRGAPGSAVFLAGSFNGWDPTAKPMTEKAADGRFIATCMLPPGTYEYKFVVNGEWTVDPANPNFVVNPLGTLNSIIEVT